MQKCSELLYFENPVKLFLCDIKCYTIKIKYLYNGFDFFPARSVVLPRKNLAKSFKGSDHKRKHQSQNGVFFFLVKNSLGRQINIDVVLIWTQHKSLHAHNGVWFHKAWTTQTRNQYKTFQMNFVNTSYTIWEGKFLYVVKSPGW